MIEFITPLAMILFGGSITWMTINISRGTDTAHKTCDNILLFCRENGYGEEFVKRREWADKNGFTVDKIYDFYKSRLFTAPPVPIPDDEIGQEYKDFLSRKSMI